MKSTKSKKYFSIILSLIMVLSALPLTAVTSFAETSGDFEYTVLDDGTAEIIKYNGSATNVIIPSTIDGYSVSEIENDTFKGYRTSLKSITIPDSIIRIGWSIFRSFTSLTSITVDSNNTVYSSENGVLFNKDKSELIVYPIGKTAEKYTIPSSVMIIDDYAFYGEESLTSITTSGSISRIGNYSFAYCKALTGFTIPNSVTDIGTSAFCDCRSLTSINIPNSVTYLGNNAFNGCSSLASITIGNNLSYVEDYTFFGCTSLKSISLPYSVTGIGVGAFENCTSLTSITIGNGVENIGWEAFCNCSMLTNITIPLRVNSIGWGAFIDCSSLTSINVEENNSNFSSQDGVLFNKAKTEIVCYPAGKTNKTFIIPGSITSIGRFAFYGCESLTSINVPDSVTSIGNGAFRNCTSLTSITIPNSVTWIGGSAFRNCTSLTRIIIPDSVMTIDSEAFFGCTSLTSVTISDGVNGIGIGAFSDCTSLTSVTIPNSVKWIFDYAFGYCTDNNNNRKKVERFTIYGYTGSTAETYAKDNDIEFVALDAPAPIVYPDVADNAWYNEAAYYNAERGWITGYKNGNFGGGDQLKRQDFVVILARIAGADLTAYENVQSTMPDVIKGSYYAAAVNWAVDNHIINGYNNGKFGVGDPITREQVCVILYRYMGSPAVTGADNTLKPFTTDAGKISSFAKNAVVWAIQNGVISGKNATTLAPTATASRAEIATIVMRMNKAGMFAA